MRIFGVVLLTVVLAGLLPALAQQHEAAAAYVPVTKFDPGRDAAKDIREAAAEAFTVVGRVVVRCARSQD